MNNEMINIILKNFLLNIYMYTISIKMLNEKMNMKIKFEIVASSLVTTLIYTIMKPYIDILFNVCISYFIQIIFLKILLKNNNSLLIGTNLLSNSIVYLVFGLSAILEYVIKYMFEIYNETINIILILLIELFVLFLFFRKKRFKDGISFLKNKINNDYINSILVNISCIVILLYSLFDYGYENSTKKILFGFSFVRTNNACYDSKNSHFILQTKVITSNH